LPAALEPSPGLLWPVPPPLPVLGLLSPDDAPPDEDPDPEALELPESVGAAAPPLAEEFAGEPVLGGGGFLFPVAVGTSVLYWTPLDSSA
jgi:hypothetical protein